MRSLIRKKERQSQLPDVLKPTVVMGGLRIRLKDVSVLNHEEISQVMELGIHVMIYLGLCGHIKPPQLEEMDKSYLSYYLAFMFAKG